MDCLTKWITTDPSRKNNDLIVKLGNQFVNKVIKEIHGWEVFVPLYGIEMKVHNPIKVGNCELSFYEKGSTYYKSVAKLKSYPNVPQESKDLFEKVPATLSFHTKASLRQAYQNANTEAQLACDVLTLFFGSYYYGIYNKKHNRPRRLSIGAPVAARRDTVYLARLKWSRSNKIGWLQEFPGQESIIINNRSLSYMRNMGLNEINNAIKTATAGKNLQQRIRLATTWFGKGCVAGSIAEAYTAYAVALESLLSEGRTPQTNIAIDVAKLIVREKHEGLFPLMQPVSKALARNIFSNANLATRRELVRQRIYDLLQYRNKIVHGHVQIDECDPIRQLDFEAIVRNAILAMALAKWSDFSQFKRWARKEGSSSLFVVFKSWLGRLKLSLP